MIQWLKDKIESRSAKAKLARFNAGYDYAAGQILRGRSHDSRRVVDLEKAVDSARTFGDFNDFDRGIEQALYDSRVRCCVHCGKPNVY